MSGGLGRCKVSGLETHRTTLIRLGLDSISLRHTLACGQAFCWRESGAGDWTGWAGAVEARVRECPSEGAGVIEVEMADASADRGAVGRYFGDGDDLGAMTATFPGDRWMRAALAHGAGLRLLRQPEWETLASFICSAVKQVRHIEAINAALRRTLGEPGAWGHGFPDAARVAAAGEAGLRRLGLGFRAKYLAATARMVAEGDLDLGAVRGMEDSAARAALMRAPGVGRKIADCVLLFAYTRWKAFPLDTWILRGLRELYFPRKRKVARNYLEEFAGDYFGPYGGLAQQYLFHWLRSKGRDWRAVVGAVAG